MANSISVALPITAIPEFSAFPCFVLIMITSNDVQKSFHHTLAKQNFQLFMIEIKEITFCHCLAVMHTQ